MIRTTRPTRDRMLMEVANVISKRSTCSLASVGVVIAHEGRILSSGYNGAPAGMLHCSHGDMAWNEQHTCDISVHAEANAIAYAARHGVSIEGAWLYSTHMPCMNCAKLIVNAGIQKVYWTHEYRNPMGLTLLEAAGLQTQYVDFD